MTHTHKKTATTDQPTRHLTTAAQAHTTPNNPATTGRPRTHTPPTQPNPRTDQPTRRVQRREAIVSASDAAVSVQAASTNASDIEVTVQAGTTRFDPEDQRWVDQVAGLEAELRREAGAAVLRRALPSPGTVPAEAVTLILGSPGALTAAVACFRAWLARDETRTLTVTWTDGQGAEQRLTISGDRVDQASFQPLTEGGGKRFTGRTGLSAPRRGSGGSLPGTGL
ncbi:effector-associated constant component EACC1 [Streptomyces sp. SLBN-31]|uniref:effector-associated constant component EACC1 n=1 Tax=Streptomyces sp. SLBN-31 TaxID=2768444 RepID=UPI0028C3F043|nr:hypothetical protein [Streptomyces sp. SLBN-31]